MDTRSVSVQEAIRRGLKAVARPTANIMIAAVVVPVLLMIIYFSWWWLLLFPAGIITSNLYWGWAARNWQIWAYDNVSDIHQLQRSAEMAGLLTKGSHERVSSMLSIPQQEKLRTLQERFANEAVFVDDPSIPGRTAVYSSRSSGSDGEPELALNSAGIWTLHDGFFDWRLIANERIPQVSYSRMRQTGRYGSVGGEYLFRFDHPNGGFEIPLSALRISVWELDLLLYIYRGRFAVGQIPTGIAIDN